MKPTEAKASVVAIGDVHGCASLLREAIWPHLGSGAELIFLGDLIDRSPEPNGDRQVIELVRELEANPEAYGLAGVTVLRGNHEQMLIEALAEDTPGAATELWEWNGADLNFLSAARDHRGWLESLPLTPVRGNCLFVHTCTRPGLEVEERDRMLCIRSTSPVVLERTACSEHCHTATTPEAKRARPVSSIRNELRPEPSSAACSHR